MTLPIITITDYNGNGSQAGFIAAISTAMQNAGFTVYDSYQNSGNENCVFSYQMSVAAKGTAYLRLGFSGASSFTQQGAGTWNTSTHTGTNYISSANLSLNLNNSYQFRAINHPEVRGVFVLVNGVSTYYFGYFRPSDAPPSWWDEALYPFAFIARNSLVAVPYPSFGSNAAAEGTNANIANTLSVISDLTPGNVNHSTCSIYSPDGMYQPWSLDGGRRMVINAPLLCNFGQGYAIHQFSSDLALVSSYSKSDFALFSVSSTEAYLSLESFNNYPVLAIRTI